MAPDAASESIVMENSIHAGCFPLESTVYSAMPPVVEPMVCGRHSALPIIGFLYRSALFWSLHLTSLSPNIIGVWKLASVLKPLMYYSFHEQGIYLWTLYCKRSGINTMYELKLKLYKALLNGDIDSAIEQTHAIMNTVIDSLSFYGA